jgi:ABC-type multidrug transport system fused ATPase/permease subunit
MSFHRNAQVGELSARATEDVGKLQNLFSDLLSPAYQNALFVAGCLVLMAMLSPAATLMIIALVAAPAPFVFLLSRRIRTLAVESRNDHASANAFLAESLAGIRDIKAFVREKLELRRYTTLLDRALGTEVASSMLHVRVNQAVYLLVSGALLVIFYAGTRGTLVPGWTIGNVIAFYFYSYTMTMAVLSIGKIYLLFQDFSAALGRITDLMDRQPVQLPAGASRHRVAGEVTFDHVSFSYDGTTEVLRDVDLTIGSGEWYLIAGPSGSGKSTLASLLMGFHHPGRGEILVDGIPLQAWDL